MQWGTGHYLHGNSCIEQQQRRGPLSLVDRRHDASYPAAAKLCCWLSSIVARHAHSIRLVHSTHELTVILRIAPGNAGRRPEAHLFTPFTNRVLESRLYSCSSTFHSTINFKTASTRKFLAVQCMASCMPPKPAVVPHRRSHGQCTPTRRCQQPTPSTANLPTRYKQSSIIQRTLRIGL